MFGKDPWRVDNDSDDDDGDSWHPKHFFNGDNWGKNHEHHYNHHDDDDDDDDFGVNMNIYYIVIIAVVVFILIFIVFCFLPCTRRKFQKMCKKKNGPTVQTTITQHHAPSPQVIPPYPIDARHPTPAPHAPMTGFNTHQPPYPTHTPNMPFPQVTPSYGFAPPPIGVRGGISYIEGHYPRQIYHYGTSWYPHSRPTSISAPAFRTNYNGQGSYPVTGQTPYPPAPYQSNDYSANPPPYDVAVAQPPIQPPPAKDGYGKQAPYNPSYN